MKFSTGDQVAFINEKQTGRIVKNLPGNMVLVAIEEGFEIPVRENELILVHREISPADHEIILNPSTVGLPDALAICEAGNACVVTVPDDAAAVLTGPVLIMLINRTGHELVFTAYIKIRENWKSLEFGTSKNESVLEIAKLGRNELKDAQSIYIRALLFRKQGWSHDDFVRREFSLLLPDIQHINKNFPGPFTYARISDIIVTKTPGIPELNQLVEKFTMNPDAKKSSDGKHHDSKRDASKRGVIETELEVDLHIEELVPDVAGLSNEEMLQIQLRHFSEAMDSAIKGYVRKIIFIHGVGSGKLKNEIRLELKRYPGIIFKDAEASRYGRGATEVILMQ